MAMDVYGKALLDYQSGLHDRVIAIRRDDGFVDDHGADLYFEPLPFPQEAEALKRATGPVLDVGCGAGRHLLWLQGQGFETFGVDNSPGAIETCRLRGCQQVMLHDIMSDGGGLPRDTFGTALLFGNNIGIGGTPEGIVRLLVNIGHLMRADGVILLTSLDVAKTDDAMHLAYHRRNRLAGRPAGEIRIRLEYDGLLGDWHTWLHPQPDELRLWAEDAGWRVDDLSEEGGGFYWAALRRNG
jgi:SAM-dependent methyltransferase